MANSLGQMSAQAARRYGIPVDLFRRLINQESGGNQGAVSPVGAIGYTQLMPKTAAGLGVDPRDPMQNLLGGAKYLRTQYDRFGNWSLALAAYNAGPNAVAQAHGIPSFPETQRYVKNIMSGVNVKAAPALKAGFDTLSSSTSTMPDLSGAVLSNLDIHDPLQQLTNLTDAVAAGGGPHTVSSVEPLPLGQYGSHKQTGPVRLTGVSLVGTNPDFAHKVSMAAGAVGATRIRLISAKRTPATNPGVANSNHLYGHAFDGEALIHGKWVPLGVALKPVASQFGLRSGDAPGFYKGGPDVNHVDDGFNQRH